MTPREPIPAPSPSGDRNSRAGLWHGPDTTAGSEGDSPPPRLILAPLAPVTARSQPGHNEVTARSQPGHSLPNPTDPSPGHSLTSPTRK